MNLINVLVFYGTELRLQRDGFISVQTSMMNHQDGPHLFIPLFFLLSFTKSNLLIKKQKQTKQQQQNCVIV